MADFDDNLLDELIIESKEHLETIEPDLMALEENMQKYEQRFGPVDIGSGDDIPQPGGFH